MAKKWCMVVIIICSSLFLQVQADVVDLRPMMTKAKFQGFRGTCSAFAATALMEFLIKQKTGEDIDLSEAYNYWATKEYTLTDSFRVDSYEKSDGHAGFMAVEAYEHGSMLESQWEYTDYNWYQLGDHRCDRSNITKECYAGTLPENATMLSYSIRPIYVDLEKIPDFLLRERKPVVVNINWLFKAIDKYGDFHMPTHEEELGGGGGHVIILVGYDSDTDRYIFKNSHGEKFGKKGYGTIPRGYIEEYYEAKAAMDSFDKYPADVQDFLIRASKGVSGELVY